MEDQGIIDLYWARNEQAIEESTQKYGGYCFSIARNILRDQQDSEECVNDTWLHAWDAMPPQRPGVLRSFLGTITRNLSISRYRASEAIKRKGNKLALAYEELEEVLPDRHSPEEQLSARELGAAIDCYLRTCSRRDRCLFLRRYWYLDSIAQISQRYGLPQGTVKYRLHMVRKGMQARLSEEGFV